MADWRTTDLDPVPWRGLRVCVVGARVVGVSVTRALLDRGAHVTLVDRQDDATTRERVAELTTAGATVRLGDDGALPEGTDLVVVSPGIRPDAAIARRAAELDVPVWGDAELAWRLRPAENAAPWLVVTGTNGKTTTVRMLESMLTAAGERAVACGNVGLPVLDAVLAQPPYDVLAVELSSFQLHWSRSISAQAAVVLNIADDHTDWHGSYEAYVAAKAVAYERCQLACVYNAADPETERLVEEADVVEGCRAVGFTLDIPSLSMLGVVDGILADRAFGASRVEREGNALELGTIYDVEPHAPHNIANALAAAALARAHGVPPAAVRDGLRAFVPDPHRIAFVVANNGVTYVDDSKATNPHAAQASLAAYEHVVWIAGGLAKGAVFDDLVRGAADRLRGVVLLGADRAVIAQALARHAPDVPVVEVDQADTGAMEQVVARAAGLAKPGDTVLLAPACASLDMFANYNVRGDAFAAAARELVARQRAASGS
jgi:UDP-N-acetylmuramoylalanine--D-glutamate ligase